MSSEDKTYVVNVKVSHIRPKYANLQEWCKDINNIYIGRKGIVFINGTRYPNKDSIWANPYKINKESNRNYVLEKYENYITEKLKNPEMVKELMKLKGKNLGCWCNPENCHGDILVKLIKKYDKQ